jgi:guanylate kinase
MYTTKQKAIERTKAATQFAILNNLATNTMKHILLVGGPGSNKTLIRNALIEECSIYEKAKAVTNRERWPGENKESNIFTSKALLKLATSLKIIEGSAYFIGKDEYGISLNELNRIISSGKKFIAFSSVEGAEVMKDIFGDELLIEYLDVPEKKRENNLKNKFNDMFVTFNVSNKVKASLMKRIEPYVKFGTEQREQYKEIAQPSTFYYVHFTDSFFAPKEAKLILDNAHSDYAHV